MLFRVQLRTTRRPIPNLGESPRRYHTQLSMISERGRKRRSFSQR